MFLTFATATAMAIVFDWGLQGGGYQHIQVTERVSIVQPAARVDTFQGNQGDSDTLQPAMGHNALSQPYTGVLEVR